MARLNLNKVLLGGNLGSDPELRHTSGGKMVCTFTLATTEGKDSPPTWHNIVVWDKLAALAQQYLSKGDNVYIEGKISNRSYDGKDGNKRYISEVIGYTIKFINIKGKEGAEPSDESTDDDLSGVF